MKPRVKQYILLVIIIVSVCGGYFYHHNHHWETLPFPQQLAQKQLLVSALSPDSVWDQEFLKQNPIIRDKIAKLEEGQLCQSLQRLDTQKLSYKEISLELKRMGFQCFMRPLSIKSNDPLSGYLKIDTTITNNPHEKGVAQQEVCYERAHPECAIRLKRDGFPLNRKSNPHSSKAVLLNGQADPGSHANEAFKIGFQGQAIPKGPNLKFGLKKCPYRKKRDCQQWIDGIMEQAHPTLKGPRG